MDKLLNSKNEDLSQILKNFYAKGRAFEDLKGFLEEALDKPLVPQVVCRTYDESYPAVFCKRTDHGKFSISVSAKHQDPEYIDLGNFEGKDILGAIKELVKQEKLKSQEMGVWYGRKEDSPNVCMR